MADMTHEALVRNIEKLSEAMEESDGTIETESVSDILNRLLEGESADDIIEDFGLGPDDGAA